jgi:hypothetical protein
MTRLRETNLPRIHLPADVARAVLAAVITVEDGWKVGPGT